MRKRLIGGLATLALASTSYAQIQYTIDGGTATALPANRIINVGTLTSGATTLHIFDSSGVDDSIVGQVEIQGTATSGASLFIKVVNQADTVTFTGRVAWITSDLGAISRPLWAD